MKIDIHNHSEHSSDGHFPVRDMCQAAGEKGVGVFAITDHFEANLWDRKNYERTIPKSFSDIEAQKPLVPFKLLTGIEMGQPLEAPKAARWLLGCFQWDFVIGSLHNTSGDEDFYFVDYAAMEDDSIFYAMKKYYRELLQMAEQADFDTLAHITYPFRYLNAARQKREITVRAEQFDADADAVFEAIIRRRKSLELNTGSITRTEEDRALNIRYFRRYQELGGELVTIGSDAHCPADVGRGLEDAHGILRDAGLRYVTYYEQRMPVHVPL